MNVSLTFNKLKFHRRYPQLKQLIPLTTENSMGNSIQAPCCGAEDVASLKMGHGKFLPTPLSPQKMSMMGV